jgi:hypothetical protein
MYSNNILLTLFFCKKNSRAWCFMLCNPLPVRVLLICYPDIKALSMQ